LDDDWPVSVVISRE